jgi:putative membrane protein
VYFFILITHILLSTVALPLILGTLWYALRSQFRFHRRVARWTLPLWLYVSVTGVVVFLILNAYTTP